MSAGLLDPDDWLQEPEGKDHGLDYLRMDDMKLLFPQFEDKPTKAGTPPPHALVALLQFPTYAFLAACLHKNGQFHYTNREQPHLHWRMRIVAGSYKNPITRADAIQKLKSKQDRPSRRGGQQFPPYTDWRGAFHLRFYYMPNEVNRELTPPDGTGLPLVNRNAVSFLGRIPSPSDLMGTPQLPRVDGIKAGFPGRSGNRFGSVPSVEVPKHLVDNKEELEHYLPINFSSGDRHTLSSVAHENWRWHHSAPNPFADLKVDDQGNLVNPALAQRVTPQWPSWSVSDDYTDVVFVMKREGNPFWPVQRGESEFRG